MPVMCKCSHGRTYHLHPGGCRLCSCQCFELETATEPVGFDIPEWVNGR